MSNTKAFIAALTQRLALIVPNTFYEEAAADKFPRAVVSGINIIDLASGDMTTFYVDFWADEKQPDATETLEELCDTVRAALDKVILSVSGTFAAHIGFENQNTVNENEHDLTHRRLSFAARIFYY